MIQSFDACQLLWLRDDISSCVHFVRSNEDFAIEVWVARFEAGWACDTGSESNARQ